MTADPQKIQNIKDGGRPQNTEDVRSLFMACLYNAKLTFDNKLNTTYEETTAPLCKLLKKGERFSWTEEEETSYQTLMKVLEDPATLQAYDPEGRTHVVSDSSEVGIQASIYQERGTDT